MLKEKKCSQQKGSEPTLQYEGQTSKSYLSKAKSLTTIQAVKFAKIRYGSLKEVKNKIQCFHQS